jgi:hypothetical protein
VEEREGEIGREWEIGGEDRLDVFDAYGFFAAVGVTTLPQALRSLSVVVGLVAGQEREFIRVQIGRGTHQQDVDAGFNGFVCGHGSSGCRVFSLLRLNSHDNPNQPRGFQSITSGSCGAHRPSYWHCHPNYKRVGWNIAPSSVEPLGTV